MRTHLFQTSFTLLAATLVLASKADAEVQFNRDVRPILSEFCFQCHGSDAATREAELRLDQFADATMDRGDGHRVIDPGNTSASELIHRITSTDDDVRMPPAESETVLGGDQIKILREWIEGGAEYEQHWSFLPIRRPSLPTVKNISWPQNAIDHFVLSRIEQEGISPSRGTDPTTLIRRVSLALTGLPPTIDEVETFEREYAVNSNPAYFRLVDRLLASPRFGEQMAGGWLDAARYADTNGYFTDLDRTMWPWRDWVINAINANMPFDTFTIEQLAGDLLPNSTIAQKIATGFNRNHMVNNETGIIEEEFRVEYVADRVDTTATVWMGLTVGCARCHDHKFDPISQEEFYRFFALFNNVPERGLSGSQGNAAPLLKVPSEIQQRRLDEIDQQIKEMQRGYAAVKQQLAEAQSHWESTVADQSAPFEPEHLVAHFALDGKASNVDVPDEIKFVRGMQGQAATFEGNACIEISDAIELERDDSFTISAWIKPNNGAGCVVSKIDDANDMRGFDVVLRKSKVVVNLVHQFNRNSIQVSTLAKVPNSQWLHLTVTYDGSSRAAGVRIYLDGQAQTTEIGQNDLTATIRNDEPFRIGRRQASTSYTGAIDDVRWYRRPLSVDEIGRLANSQLVAGIVAAPEGMQSADQTKKLRALFLQNHADPADARVAQKLDEALEEQRRLIADTPTTMVMEESDEINPAFILVRGQYDQHGKQVTPGVPEFLDIESGSQRQTNDRLDLAKWLVAPSHPLTARVTVNRIWERLFGTGLVRTADDFGTQGELPSHPELLDWLAMELIETDWDVKRLMRLIVSSATYRQSSNCSAELWRIDSENRWLARGPRFRMDAEMVRDNALAVSGLIVEKLGGPPVMPYQPAGVWADVTYDSDRDYLNSDGESLYRRSLYTFWKRQSPPSNMLVFDAPTRETCLVQRSRTNTPLQALALMNDPTFVEAARKLAERVMLEDFDQASNRIAFAFRLATARNPSREESDVLVRVFRQQLDSFGHRKNAAAELVSVGSSPRNPSLDVTELAAWTTVASVILCLDETITRR